MKQKSLFAWMTIIAFILFIITVTYLIMALERTSRLDPLELEAMTQEQIIQRVYETQNGMSLSFILPIFGFFGVFVGALVYFLLLDNEKTIVSKPENTSQNGIGIEVLRRALSHDERKVFDLLRTRNGMLMQSEVSSIEGFNKVKAHRIVDMLESKGIVTKTTAGKQRVIRFVSDFDSAIPKNGDGFTKQRDGITK
jgi:uncharacterized membrane protein